MDDVDITRVRSITGTTDVQVVTDPVDVVVVGYDTREALRPRTIVRIGQQYLVETHDEPDDWYMGELTGSVIVCHGRYGRLDEAIRGL
jgi:hypothetical protein